MAHDRQNLSRKYQMNAATSSCEICGGRLGHAAIIPGYQEPHEYAILDCSDCGTMVASPKRADPAVYDAIYSVSGGPPGYDRNFQYARRITRRRDPLAYLAARQDAFWGVRSALEAIAAERVLEVGCGLGYFTYALRRSGYDATGIDFSKAAITRARSAYGNFFECRSLESYVTDSAQRFDAVVLVEVVEHLEDPLSPIRDAVKLLNPGGAIILTTPNRSFFSAMTPWSTDLPPVHLWWFSEESIRTMSRKLRCNVSFVDFTPYNARYPVVHIYQGAQQSTLDAAGNVVRRESTLVAAARRLGVLQDAYRLVTILASPFVRASGPRRPTMVAAISPALTPTAM